MRTSVSFPGLLRILQFGPQSSDIPRMFSAGCLGQPWLGCWLSASPRGMWAMAHGQTQGKQCLLSFWASVLLQSFHGSLPYKAMHSYNQLLSWGRLPPLPPKPASHPAPQHFRPSISQQESFYLGGLKSFNLWPYACNSTQSI